MESKRHTSHDSKIRDNLLDASAQQNGKPINFHALVMNVPESILLAVVRKQTKMGPDTHKSLHGSAALLFQQV